MRAVQVSSSAGGTSSTSRSAAAVKARAAGLSASARTTGRPGVASTDHRRVERDRCDQGTPSDSARSRPPPSPKRL